MIKASELKDLYLFDFKQWMEHIEQVVIVAAKLGQESCKITRVQGLKQKDRELLIQELKLLGYQAFIEIAECESLVISWGGE